MEEDIDDIWKLDEVIGSEKDNLAFLDHLSICPSDEDENNDTLWKYNLHKKVNDDKDSFDLDLMNTVNIDSEVDVNQIKAYINVKDLQMILQCKDENLKRLMILNRYKLIQLKSLEVYINSLHAKCTNEDKTVTVECRGTYPLAKIGYPYFKTLNNNTCPPNNDVNIKSNNGEIWIDYMHSPTIWSDSDIIDLRRTISMCYYKNQRNELDNKLMILKNKIKLCKTVSETKQIEGKIEKVKEKIKETETCELKSYPKLHSTKVHIDWYCISEVDLRGRHSVRSCQAVWNLFLHPSLNRTNWSKNELMKLYRIADKYSCQNWEAIANSLGTKRSAYICCIKYFTRMYDRKTKYFTKEEDNKLLDIIDKHRIGDYIRWNVIQHNFGTRTKRQLYSRYMNMLIYEDKINKGNFSKLEDILLYCLCKVYGENFKLCKNVLKTRNEIQIRLRYKNYITRTENVQNGYWTLEEDKIVLEHINQEGDLLANKLMKQLNRTTTSIRHRSYILMEWLHKNPGKDIDKMIRKKGVALNTNQYLEEIRSLGDNFLSKKIDINVDNVTAFLQENHGRKRGRPPGIIKQTKIYGMNKDTALINYFKNMMITKNVRKSKVDKSNVQISASVIASYLNMLNVKLDIPDDDGLESTPDLEDFDLLLLNQLRKMPERNKNDNNLIPPILNSVVSLRHLLLNFVRYKTESSNTERCSIFKYMTTYQCTLTEDESESYAKQCMLFKNRLNAIYMWPSVMSLIKRTYDPNPADQLETIAIQEDEESRIKKVGRPKKNLTKVMLMNKARAIKKVNQMIQSSLPATSCVLANFTEIKSAFTTRPTFTYCNRKKANEVEENVNNAVASSSSLSNNTETTSMTMKILANVDKEKHNTFILKDLTTVENRPNKKMDLFKNVMLQSRKMQSKRFAIKLEGPNIKKIKTDLHEEYDIKSEMEDIELLEAALKDEA